MKLSTEQKNINILIDSYEFPYHKTNTEEDNNWLNIKAICEDEVLIEEGIQPCLMTFELTDLLLSLQAVASAKQKEFESDFVEDILQIKVKPHEDGIALYISFLLPHHYDNPFVFVKRMTLLQLQDWINDLQEQAEKFPPRINEVVSKA